MRARLPAIAVATQLPPGGTFRDPFRPFPSVSLTCRRPVRVQHRAAEEEDERRVGDTRWPHRAS